MVHRRELSVGIFVILGLALFILLTVTLREWDFLARRVTYFVMFERIERLDTGAPVLAHGARVGSVTRIEFVGGDYPVRVAIRVDPTVPLYEDARIRVVPATVIGETTVNIIDMGTPPEALEPYSVLIGLPPAMLEEIALDLSEQVGMVMRELMPTLQVINEVVGDPEHQEMARRTIQNIAESTEALQQMLTLINEQLEPLLGELRTAQDQAGRFIQTATSLTLSLEHRIGFLETAAERTMGDISTAAETFGREVVDSSAELSRIMERLEQAIQRGESPLIEAIEEAGRSARQLSGIMGRIERGEGTLGALIQDRRPFDQLRELLTAVSGALTGRREPAFPVSPDQPAPSRRPDQPPGGIMPPVPDQDP